MVKFKTTIMRFDRQGEKTGWTYISVPASIAAKLKPGNKKGFRVKGKIDEFSFHGSALLPMGGGDFILTLNAAFRKGIGKGQGASVIAVLEADDEFKIVAPPELVECLEDEPTANLFFNKLTISHQGYFIKWIESAKTEETKARRIANTVNACLRKQDFGMMLRSIKKEKPI